jgi:tRNA pseudouridine32 synthase / 2,5-diamino-6-(5-phospho-D-ribitylamino)-pyrimidin-4(3H)-one deaminase
MLPLPHLTKASFITVRAVARGRRRSIAGLYLIAEPENVAKMGGKRRPWSAGPGKEPRPAKRIKRVRDADEDLAVASETDYFISNGLRYVVPYTFQYRMSCKARWRGRRVLDVFNAELSKKNEPNYWRDEFLGRRVVVNGKAAEFGDVWRHNDLVLHSVHRHESPVLHREIAIVHVDERFLVVDKPASIPVHPCGTYRRASLLYLLAAEGWTDLRLVHRLDKQTSGIVIFGRTREAANEFIQALAARSLRKRYLARVRGCFPDSVTVACREPLAVDEREMRTVVDRVDGKEAQTLFRAVAFDPDSNQSLVVCEPLTGRSHQIRVHLLHMGFPIANDPMYDNATKMKIAAKKDAGFLRKGLRLDDRGEGIDKDGVVSEQGAVHNCSTCPFVANSLDVDLDDGMQMYLHALEYEGNGWKYATKPPSWANVCGSGDVGESIGHIRPLRETPTVDYSAVQSRNAGKRAWLPRASTCAIV